MSGTQPPMLPGELRNLKLVPNEPIPDALTVCSAKVRNDVATALRARFETGATLPANVKAKYEAHLAYCYELGDRIYEAGPSGDFNEILYIYSTGNLDEAKELMHADPFYGDGIFYDDCYFEWSIHCPSYKSSSAPMPEQVVEIKVDVQTPKWLIASLGKLALPEPPDAGIWPLGVLMHVYNMYGEGSLGRMGYAWGAGPDKTHRTALHIYAVPSIEMARFFNESEAMYRWGMAEDFRYFEWFIHYPFKKVSPLHRDVLAQSLSEANGALSSKHSVARK